MIQEHKRSRSIGKLGYTTLRDLANLKHTKIISSSLSRLRDLKTTYDKPFLASKHLLERQNENEEEEEAATTLHHLFETDFSQRSKKLCEDTIFQVHAFTKIYKENHRIKAIFTKLHGWDEHFEEIFFPHKRSELKIGLTASEIHQKLGFGFKTLNVRNIFNKLRLFLGELIAFNKRQQQLEGKFMKARIGNQLNKLDKEMMTILMSKHKSDGLKYVNEITKTHDLMLTSKLKIRNKIDNINQIQQQFGRININEFYIKQERSINEIQQYFTNNRLKKNS